MIKLIADSTCDLSDDIIDKYNIGIAPLSITIDGKTYQDRVDLTREEFYRRMPDFKDNPTTAMPSPAVFMDLFEAAFEKGYTEIMCVCMSSGTSGSYQSAMIARNDFMDQYPGAQVHVVDSKSMSHGSGYLILKSAKLIEQGASYSDVFDFLETYKTNVKHFLAVDDLNPLIRSGRLTNVSAMLGKMLKINPIMSMRSGKGAIVAKVRSSKKVIRHYVREFSDRVDPELTDFIIVGYTSSKEKADQLIARLKNDTDFAGEIYAMQMGMAVGTHVGLKGLSMFFIEKGDRQDGLMYNTLKEVKEKKKEVLQTLRRLKDQQGSFS